MIGRSAGAHISEPSRRIFGPVVSSPTSVVSRQSSETKRGWEHTSSARPSVWRVRAAGGLRSFGRGPFFRARGQRESGTSRTSTFPGRFRDGRACADDVHGFRIGFWCLFRAMEVARFRGGSDENFARWGRIRYGTNARLIQRALSILKQSEGAGSAVIVAGCKRRGKNVRSNQGADIGPTFRDR